jgi:hypothetical protein
MDFCHTGFYTRIFWEGREHKCLATFLCAIMSL